MQTCNWLARHFSNSSSTPSWKQTRSLWRDHSGLICKNKLSTCSDDSLSSVDLSNKRNNLATSNDGFTHLTSYFCLIRVFVFHVHPWHQICARQIAVANKPPSVSAETHLPHMLKIEPLSCLRPPMCIIMSLCALHLHGQRSHYLHGNNRGFPCRKTCVTNLFFVLKFITVVHIQD